MGRIHQQGRAQPPAWYERLPERLVLEGQVMRERFPQFQLVCDGNGVLSWRGSLRTNRGNVYELAIIYPTSFPDDAPQAKPINPAIEVFRNGRGGRLQHQYSDGLLCLYYPGDRTMQKDTTAATVVALAAAWLFAYESWLESGRRHWPGIEAD